MGIPDHLACLLRNLYAGQKETVRTEHGPTGWFQIGKEVYQDCILSPCQWWYVCHDAEYIMCIGLDEAQPGIKIAGGNINNLRYADDTTLMAGRGEDLKSLLMKVKGESEKFGLNLNIQKTKIMASSPITSWQIDGGNSGNSGWLYFWGLQNHCRWWLQPWNKRRLLLERKVMSNLDSIFKSRDITLPTKVRLVKAMVFLWSCMDVRVGLWRRLSTFLMLLNCGVGEDSWESLGLQGDPTSPFWRRSALGFLWKEWC